MGENKSCMNIWRKVHENVNKIDDKFGETGTEVETMLVI